MPFSTSYRSLVDPINTASRAILGTAEFQAANVMKARWPQGDSALNVRSNSAVSISPLPAMTFRGEVNCRLSATSPRRILIT